MLGVINGEELTSDRLAWRDVDDVVVAVKSLSGHCKPKEKNYFV